MKHRFIPFHAGQGGDAPVTQSLIFFGEYKDLRWLAQKIPGKIQVWDPESIRVTEPEERLDGSGQSKYLDGAWLTVEQ